MDEDGERRSRWYDVSGALVVVGTVAWIVFGLVSSHEELPECSDVWTVGSMLERGYRGCEYPSGAAEGSGFACGDDRVLFDYRHELYAPAGGTIMSGYEEVYQRCLTGS